MHCLFGGSGLLISTDRAAWMDRMTTLSYEETGGTTDVVGHLPGSHSLLTGSTTPPTNASYSVAEKLHRDNMTRVAKLTPFLVYIVLLMLVGLVGNSLAFLVYHRRFPHNPTRTYILAISLCDLMTNVVALIAEMTDAFFYYTFYWDWACKLLKTVMNVLCLFSGFVLVAVALERQSIVCARFPTARRQRGRTVMAALAVCCTLSVGLSVPRAVLLGSDPLEGGAYCNTQDSYWDSPFPVVYNLALIVVFLLTLVTMCVCYLRIAVHLWRHNRRSDAVKVGSDPRLTNSNSADASAERKGGVSVTVTTTTTTSSSTGCGAGKKIPTRTTLMLFVVTAVFVFNYLPYLVVEVILFVTPDSPFWNTNLSVLYVLLRSFYLNSSVNAFVYSFCSARFRYECRQLFSKTIHR
ncbi:vasopressin V1a receptor-like [Babylonia areolata]|uniref:vasopressin V1a receptor-like n=1 Tax=Babylonia areolata TaxID=304850 RepID=UPI003FD28A7F